MILVTDTHTGNSVIVPRNYWTEYRKANETYPEPRYRKEPVK